MHCIAIDQRVNSVWLIMEAGGYYFSTEQVASLAQRQVGFGWLQTDWCLILCCAICLIYWPIYKGEFSVHEGKMVCIYVTDTVCGAGAKESSIYSKFKVSSG